MKVGRGVMFSKALGATYSGVSLECRASTSPDF
jgi:hypothetical protein